MKQRDVTKEAYRQAAALVENMDLEQLFGDPDTWTASEDQMTKAQNEVVEALQARGSTTK